MQSSKSSDAIDRVRETTRTGKKPQIRHRLAPKYKDLPQRPPERPSHEARARELANVTAGPHRRQLCPMMPKSLFVRPSTRGHALLARRTTFRDQVERVAYPTEALEPPVNPVVSSATDTTTLASSTGPLSSSTPIEAPPGKTAHGEGHDVFNRTPLWRQVERVRIC